MAPFTSLYEDIHMNRTPINRLLCALALMIGMLAAGTGTAAAQNCCTFTAEVLNVPAACFKIQMTTSWGGILTTHTFSANGIYPNLPFLSTACPPAPPFNWVSLDGGITKIVLGETRVVRGNNNCCFTVRAGLDAAGCVSIMINGLTSTPC